MKKKNVMSPLPKTQYRRVLTPLTKDVALGLIGVSGYGEDALPQEGTDFDELLLSTVGPSRLRTTVLARDGALWLAREEVRRGMTVTGLEL